jgi:hypothetical protein
MASGRDARTSGVTDRRLRAFLLPIPLLAPLRHAECVKRCPSLKAKRKTCAHTEFFSV